MLRELLLRGLTGVGFVGCSRESASPPPPKETVIKAGEIGSRLPAFTVDDLQGTRFRLLISTARWCSSISGPPSVSPASRRRRDIKNWWAAMALKASSWSGSNSTRWRIRKDPLKFVKKIGVRYPLAVATDDLKQKFGGIEGLPTTMLFDRGGILRQKVIGFEYTKVIEKDLKPLL